MRYLSLLNLIFLISFLPYFSHAEVTRGNGSQAIDPTNSNFENIGVNENVRLASYESSDISGFELQCYDNDPNSNRIMFCQDGCGENPTPQSDGPRTSQECANFLDAWIRECVEEMGCYNQVRFCGVGGHAKRKKNTPSGPGSPSRHSSGDALDLFGITCRQRNGSQLAMDLSSQGRNQNTEAYDKFVACWRKKVEEYEGPKDASCRGAISCQGSEEPNNELHNDHVHLSCPTPRSNTGGT